MKKLMDASVSPGKYNLTRDGDDISGEKVVNGTYLVSVFINGKMAVTEKLGKKGK